MSGGGERMPMRQLPFKHLQLQGLLTVIAVTDNCLSFSLKGNLETCSVKILVAVWCVCVCARARSCRLVGVCVCVCVCVSNQVVSEEWKEIFLILTAQFCQC